MEKNLTNNSIIEIVRAYTGPCLFNEDGFGLDYKDLTKNIESIGRQLSSIEMKNNKICALVLPNGIDMAISFLALTNYVTVSPLNPNYTKDEFLFFLEDLDCEFIITDNNASNALIEAAKQLEIKLFYIDNVTPKTELLIKQVPLSSICSVDENKGDDFCLILHTSGTTSRPKQVQLSCTNIISSAFNISSVLKLEQSDKGLNIMPLFHIHGLIASLLSSIITGASLVCTNGFNALTFYGNIKNFKPTWITAVPTMYQAILSRASRNKEIIEDADLRLLRSSSAAMPIATIEALESVFQCPVIEAYGMTEASHQMASNFLDSIRKAGSVGKPAGPEIAIYKDDKLIENSAAMGKKIESYKDMLLSHPTVKDMRGWGLMWVLEMVENKDSGEYFSIEKGAEGTFHSIAMQNGLVFYSTMYGRRREPLFKRGLPLMISPPLCINESQIEEMMEKVDHSISLWEAEMGVA